MTAYPWSDGADRARVAPRPAVASGEHKVRIRPASAPDADAIRAIYNYEVLNSTATFDLVPRSLEEQQTWLANRSGVFSAVVAVVGASTGPIAAAPPSRSREEVVGFAALSPYKERAAYRTTVEDSIYVRQDRQGLGVGQALLTSLLDLSEASGFHAVMARIEVGGVASRALHEACGFRLVGIEREVGRKFNRWLDVAVMQCVLAERPR
jgi:phosphinothricin acetyltransferase